MQITVKELPDADDEFASEVSEFETLAEYKEDIKKKLTEKKEKEARAKKEAQAVEKAVENATMEIPDAMIDDPGSEHDGRFRQKNADLRVFPWSSTSSSPAWMQRRCMTR